MLGTTILLLACALAIAQPLIPEPGPPMAGGLGHHGAAHGIPIGLGGGGLGGYGLGGGGYGYPGSVVKHTESVSTGLGGYGHGLGGHGAYGAYGYPGLAGLGYGAYGFPAAKQITHVTTTNVRPGGYYGGLGGYY